MRSLRCSRAVTASGCQCRIRNCPGFDPTILRHTGILGATDEAVFNNVHTKKKIKKIPLLKIGTVVG
jgi:hypothetical protein